MIKTVVGACALDCPDACSWVVTREDDVSVKLGATRITRTPAGVCA